MSQDRGSEARWELCAAKGSKCSVCGAKPDNKMHGLYRADGSNVVFPWKIRGLDLESLTAFCTKCKPGGSRPTSGPDSKRERYAAMVMQALAPLNSSPEEVAARALSYADALIAALTEPQESPMAAAAKRFVSDPIEVVKRRKPYTRQEVAELFIEVGCDACGGVSHYWGWLPPQFKSGGTCKDKDCKKKDSAFARTYADKHVEWLD